MYWNSYFLIIRYWIIGNIVLINLLVATHTPTLMTYKNVFIVRFTKTTLRTTDN